jgi:hypothetical protein
MEISDKEQNLIKYHREVLASKDHMIEDGALTSIYIVGVTNPANGRIYNVPGYFDGKIQSDKDAADRASSIGWDKFPSYENGEQANRAAEKLHKIIEQDGVEFMSLLTQSRGVENGQGQTEEEQEQFRRSEESYDSGQDIEEDQEQISQLLPMVE